MPLILLAPIWWLWWAFISAILNHPPTTSDEKKGAEKEQEQGRVLRLKLPHDYVMSNDFHIFRKQEGNHIHHHSCPPRTHSTARDLTRNIDVVQQLLLLLLPHYIIIRPTAVGDGDDDDSGMAPQFLTLPQLYWLNRVGSACDMKRGELKERNPIYRRIASSSSSTTTRSWNRCWLLPN